MLASCDAWPGLCETFLTHTVLQSKRAKFLLSHIPSLLVGGAEIKVQSSRDSMRMSVSSVESGHHPPRTNEGPANHTMGSCNP